MSWKTPTNWATGTPLTPALLNLEIRDEVLSARNGFDRAVGVSRAANFSLAASGHTVVPWTVTDWIVGSTAIFTTASGSKLVACEAGWWRVMGTMVLNSVSGAMGCGYYRGGATNAVYELNQNHVGAAGTAREFFGSDILMTTASSDYIELTGMFRTGTSATVIGGATGSRFTWSMLGGST